MIFWTIVNVVTALLVSGIVVYMLNAYHERFSIYERVALVMIASGMVMRIAPILGKNILKVESPFDDWSTSFLHLGVAGLFVCLLWRMERREAL